MIDNLIIWSLNILIAFGLVLYFINHYWFERYIGGMISIFNFIAQIFAGILIGLGKNIPQLLIGVVKFIIGSAVVTILGFIYIITFAVPHVGKQVEGWKETIETRLYSSYIVTEAREMRDIMISIVSEGDSRDLDFNEPEAYYDELASVKEKGKDRLETGESVLSIVLGLVLIGANIAGVKILQVTVFGYSVAILIEMWLLAIAVSIIYRTSILEFLAYTKDDQFNSLEEMDVALGYQKGISLVGFIQGLVVFLILLKAITRIKSGLVRQALRDKYEGKPWVRRAFKRLNE